MARLLLLTASDLSRDPRARRARLAAEGLGWDVAVASLGPPSAARGGGSASGLARELRGLYRLVRLAARTVALVRRGRGSAADIVHANDLDTLPAGWLLARRHRSRLVYDAHELYIGFEARPPRLWARAIRILEGALARRADAVVTASDGIAAELEQIHGLPRRPLVVLNCPPLEPVELEARNGRVRAVYQAAVGPGRELGDLESVAAAGVDVTARVIGLEGALHGVEVVPPVGSDGLVPALVVFDLGLVIDRPVTRNAELALPNKLFEYFMAGLAVVVPNAPEMASLVSQEQVGVVYGPGELGPATAALAADRRRVDGMRRRARSLAEASFNAEAQAPALHRAWGL
jgi:glycosyltransferase involved in cell wall biosynthesis